MRRLLLLAALFLVAGVLQAGTLDVNPSSINAWEGGQFTFYLDAGPGNAHRSFMLFGTLTGTAFQSITRKSQTVTTTPKSPPITSTP